MKPDDRPDRRGAPPGELELNRSLEIVLESAPSAFAVTKGSAEVYVYANTAFRRLIGSPERRRSVHAHELIIDATLTRLQKLLDRAWSRSEVLHDQFLGPLNEQQEDWSCSIWPLGHTTLSSSLLVVELHPAMVPAPNLALQRSITERLLLASLRDTEAKNRAQSALAQAEFLAEAGLRLGMSLDQNATRDTVACITLPIPDTWCLVDIIEEDGSISRLKMSAPDRRYEDLLRELGEHWSADLADGFGAPAMLRGAHPIVIGADAIEQVLQAAAHSPHNLRLLRELSIGSLLTVPMVSGERLFGGVTFFTRQLDNPFTNEIIGMAERLADRNAEALMNSLLHAQAISLRDQAEAAAKSRLRFLADISHELRTPLNAILGFAEVIAEQIHGPVTAAQLRDLHRIMLNHEHLGNLVTELLDFVRAGAPRPNEEIKTLAHESLAEVVDLLETTISEKGIQYYHDAPESAAIALADPERLHQILINLLANAIKFTASGGRITSSCLASGDEVLIRICDTGVGIPKAKIGAIFEPFVQLHPGQNAHGGVGLGLAISRDLARAMGGDLTVESSVGIGTCFTLVLPRATATPI